GTCAGRGLGRIGQCDAGFDRHMVKLMEAGDHAALAALTAKELHESGSHELLNWLVLLGAVSPARARVRFYGEMGRVDLAALEWNVARAATRPTSSSTRRKKTPR